MVWWTAARFAELIGATKLSYTGARGSLKSFRLAETRSGSLKLIHGLDKQITECIGLSLDIFWQHKN